MKGIFRKTMSILLVVTMLLGTIVFGIADIDWSEIAIEAEAVETFTEGYYTYTVDDEDNAIITDVDTSISGDIVIPSTLGRYNVTKVYGFSGCRNITSIIIPNSVNKICTNAFRDCVSLTNLVIPDSVTEIESDAFIGCTGLKNLKLPKNLKTLEANVFSKCTGLISVTIPDSVTSIGDRAFYGCTSLTSVTIPDSVTSTGVYAFYGCTGLASVTVSDSITSISECAFSGCTSLTSITISGNVKTIEKSAFSGCESLSNITFEKGSVLDIGDYAFYKSTALENLDIPDRVNSIGRYAFAECENLENITISDNVKIIGNNAFDSTKYHKDAEYDNDVLYIGNHLIKAKLGNKLESYEIREGTKTISCQMFSNSEKLKSVKIPDSVTCIADKMFYKCTALTDANIPDSVAYIGDQAFYGCSTLKNISIPDSATYIGVNAFCGCTSFSNVLTIPEGVTEIGASAFYGCSNITELNFNAINCSSVGGSFSTFRTGITTGELAGSDLLPPQLTEINIGNKVEIIPEAAFMNCINVEKIDLPECVKTIGKNAFNGCKSLKSVVIPRDVTFIGECVFANCTALESVTVNAVRATIEEDSGMGRCNTFLKCDALKNVTIGPDVEIMPSETDDPYNVKYNDSLFYANKTIKTLNFNARNCEQLTSCFDGCSSLTEINIGSGVESLQCSPEYPGSKVFKGTAFYNDESNWEVKLNSKVLYIDNCLIAVEKMSGNYNIKDGTRLIADSAFFEKVNLSGIEIPDSVKYIGDYSFQSCNSLKKINISMNVEEIGYLAFRNLGNLQEFEVNPANKFYCNDSCGVLFSKDMTQLIQYPVGNKRTEYTIPEGVNAVCDYAFSAGLKGSEKGLTWHNHGNLVTVILADSVEKMGKFVFKYHTSLVNFNIGKNSKLKLIDSNCFDYCRSLEKIVLPNSLESIGDEAFSWCDKIDGGYLHIPSNVIELGLEILNDAWIIPDVFENSLSVGLCSDKAEGYVKNYADSNFYPFKLCNGDHSVNQNPTEPTTKPSEPITKPTEPTTKPTVPSTKPSEPATNPEDTTKPSVSDDTVVIRIPSQSTVAYGDSIILHADTENLPDGASIVWSANNNNFKIVSHSIDGENCTVTPVATGDTVFTATVVDADGNEISSDTQTMTAKAGFFQKIIAFFKKLFGLTKVIPEVFKF